MLPIKFEFDWPNGFRKKIFEYFGYMYTEKKVIRGHFSNSFFVSKPCSKLHDFLPKDVSFK